MYLYNKIDIQFTRWSYIPGIYYSKADLARAIEVNQTLD